MPALKNALVFVALSACLLPFGSAQIPIPSRPLGVTKGAVDAPIVLEAFYDLMCPDCRGSYPGIQAVIDHYGASTVQFKLHPFPLPYHHNSYYANQAVYAILSATKDTDKVFTWVDAIFKNQEAFGNKPTAALSATEVISKMGDLAESSGVLKSADFVAGLANGATDEDLRVSFKYGCSRNVLGTPTVLVNGVSVAASPAWGLSEWKQVLDPLVHPVFGAVAGKKAPFSGTCPDGQPRCEYLPGKVECCLAGEFCVPNVGCRC